MKKREYVICQLCEAPIFDGLAVIGRCDLRLVGSIAIESKGEWLLRASQTGPTLNDNPEWAVHKVCLIHALSK